MTLNLVAKEHHPKKAALIKMKDQNLEGAKATPGLGVAPPLPMREAPKWTMLRFAFVMLGLCLIVMLSLAFSSSDFGFVLSERDGYGISRW
ncbi:hypothetical protein GBA52_010313 [Prunus armeniaca]|nr:hypothetical protein GBA52_010313 [Prunus armeniaca]